MSIYDFYDPDLYDTAAGDSDPRDDTVAYYLSKAGPVPRRVLDIGAGTGRLAMPLIQAGHRVVCVDRSGSMIGALTARLQALSSELRERATVVCQPFSGRDDVPEVELAVGMDDFVLHLLNLNELSKFFRDLASWLPIGGTFLTDVRPRKMETLLAHSSKPVPVRTFGMVPLTNREMTKLCHCCTLSWEEYNADTRHLTTTCQYVFLSSTGSVERSFFRVLSQRVHTNAELLAAATENGFQLLAHTARNQDGTTPGCDIGGSFAFILATSQ